MQKQKDQIKSAKGYKRYVQWPRTFLIVAGAVLIFGLGYGLGDGRISLNGVRPNQANQNLPNNLDYSTVEEVYKSLKRNFDGELTNDQLLEGMKRGLAESTGDPYTEFFNPDEAKEFQGDLDGSFEGIGAELGKEDSSIIIISPIDGYPAQKAGLKPKDIILKIDGQPASDISISEAVKKIRGPKGTKVTLTVVRDGKPLDIEITREKIDIPSVEYKLEGSIGYIKVIRFGDDTVKLVREASTNLKAQGAKGIILDLRSNPGGYLNGAVDVASIWLEKGDKVVEEKRGGEVQRTHYATGNSSLLGVPTVVLINGGSASASEIVAGALRDNNSATLVGEKTYGKGSVQQIENFRNGSALKVTIARWFTPAGINIDKEGIKPDVEVIYSSDDANPDKDPQKDKAIELLRQKIQ